MSKINLLPPDLSPKRSFLRLVDILTKVLYVVVAVFLISILTFLGIFIIGNTKIKTLNTQKDILSKEINEYQKMEQQVVLAKDRMTKIKDIWKLQGIKKPLESFEELSINLSEGVLIKDAKISSAKSEVTTEVFSSLSVSKFMVYLVSSNLYKTIRLKNFSFNPNYGFRITFEGYVD